MADKKVYFNKSQRLPQFIDSKIEFRNEVSGDQFRVILWRSDLKEESSEKSSEKLVPGIESKEKSDLESVLKSNLKSDLKVLELLKQTPTLTISQLQEIIGLSRSGIKKILNQLKVSGKIRRVGPDKGGHWEICQ